MESAIAPTSSSTGTRKWRNGPSSLPRAGDRSAKGVVQPSSAALASTSTPTIEKRMKLPRPPRPSLSEPRWASGRPPDTRARTAPAATTPPSHHGSLGLIPRGRRAARNATSTSAPTMPIDFHDGQTSRAIESSPSATSLVPAHMRWSGLVPGTNRTTWISLSCKLRARLREPSPAVSRSPPTRPGPVVVTPRSKRSARPPHARPRG